MDGNEDLSNFFKLKNAGAIAFQVTPLGELVWDVSVLHDEDGYGVGITIHGRNGLAQLHLNPNEANAMGMGMLQAAAMGRAWERVRERAN